MAKSGDFEVADSSCRFRWIAHLRRIGHFLEHISEPIMDIKNQRGIATILRNRPEFNISSKKLLKRQNQHF